MPAANVAADVVTTALGVGAVLVLTRPKSQGPAFAKAIGDAALHLVQGATGQTISK